jgi:type VI protein secretion system component Hcp
LKKGRHPWPRDYAVSVAGEPGISLKTSNSLATANDAFSLNFAKIEVEYRAQKDDGTLDSAVTAGYDLKANKPV